MPARSIGSATISFGLVSIPVKIYSASSESSRVSFNLLHAKCGSRLKQQYTCPKDNEIVPADDMVKGYEFAKDRYVQFTKDEVKALEEKPNQTIDIAEFVPVRAIDLVYFDKAYYLGPDKGGDRAYALLGKAMSKTSRVALARYAARGKQYLVLVRVSDNLLVMQQLHYADEIRSADEVTVSKTEVKDSELQLAMQLIDQIASDSFNPQNYHDEVKARALEAIQRKVDGAEITVAEEAQPRAQIVDLMAALKASISADGKKRPAKRVTKPAAAVAKPRKRSTAK